MRMIKKVLFIIFIIIFIPLFIYNVVFFCKSMMRPNQVPDFLGYKTFIVLSGSMKPKFDINDMVVVKKVLEEKIKKDDIIAFNASNKIVTHRIIDIIEIDGDKHYVTKGDFNNTTDEGDITYDDMEGKVVFVIPKIGKVFKAFQGKTVIFILMLVAFVICLYHYISA